jgi:hypothetical protein
MKYLKLKHSLTVFIKHFPSKAQQKHFASDEISNQVSFSFEGRE